MAHQVYMSVRNGPLTAQAENGADRRDDRRGESDGGEHVPPHRMAASGLSTALGLTFAENRDLFHQLIPQGRDVLLGRFAIQIGFALDFRDVLVDALPFEAGF